MHAARAYEEGELLFVPDSVNGTPGGAFHGTAYDVSISAK